MAIKSMTWANSATAALNRSLAVWYSDRAVSTGLSDTYLIPEGRIESIGASLFTNTGITGSFAQTQEGTVSAKEIQTLIVGGITAVADGILFITLDNVIFTIPVFVGETVANVAAKIRAAAAQFLPDWVVTGADNDAIFTASANGVRDGDYEFKGDGTATFEYSFSPKNLIEQGSGMFVTWDASIALNTAITAWRLKATAGSAAAEVTVKTVR
jgi:hypothetical protein